MQTTTFCTIQPQSSDRSPFHAAYPVKGKGTVRILTVPKLTTSGTLCLPGTPITVAALATHLCTFFSMLGVFHDMCDVLCVERCVSMLHIPLSTEAPFLGLRSRLRSVRYPRKLGERAQRQ